MATYAQAAYDLVQSRHLHGHIVAEGGLFTRGMDDGEEGMVSGHTIVIDLAGQGQDLRVYEVLFSNDGTGVILQAAASISNGALMPDSFSYDLIRGEVENVEVDS